MDTTPAVAVMPVKGDPPSTYQMQTQNHLLNQPRLHQSQREIALIVRVLRSTSGITFCSRVALTLVLVRGEGTIFFLGGKSVDMPSDCQILGGHRHIHPIETKSWGQLPPLPPPPGSRAPGFSQLFNSLGLKPEDRHKTDCILSYHKLTFKRGRYQGWQC